MLPLVRASSWDDADYRASSLLSRGSININRNRRFADEQCGGEKGLGGRFVSIYFTINEKNPACLLPVQRSKNSCDIYVNFFGLGRERQVSTQYDKRTHYYYNSPTGEIEAGEDSVPGC
jgi:hypothetical protein